MVGMGFTNHGAVPSTSERFTHNTQGPISLTDLSLASYHFVLDLSPKTDLSLFMKLAPGVRERYFFKA